MGCTSSGGCQVRYVGPSRGGRIQGSCFPRSFGGSCSGTPSECCDCNEAIQCSEGGGGGNNWSSWSSGWSNWGSWSSPRRQTVCTRKCIPGGGCRSICK